MFIHLYPLVAQIHHRQFGSSPIATVADVELTSDRAYSAATRILIVAVTSA